MVDHNHRYNMGTVSTLFLLANIIIAMIKNKIGIIKVTTKNTKGIVTTAANRNKKPERILIFIDINAKKKLIDKR